MEIGRHCRRRMKWGVLPPRARSWSAKLAQTLELHRQCSRRHWLSCSGIYYLEQNVQRRLIMKYLTNSVWSSWLSQRGWLPREAGELKNSLLAIFPWHLESQNKGVQRSKSREVSIIKQEGRQGEGRQAGVGLWLLLKKVMFFSFYLQMNHFPLSGPSLSKPSQPFGNWQQFFFFFFLSLCICQWILAEQKETDLLSDTQNIGSVSTGDGGVRLSIGSVTRTLMWQEELFLFGWVEAGCLMVFSSSVPAGGPHEARFWLASHTINNGSCLFRCA